MVAVIRELQRQQVKVFLLNFSFPGTRCGETDSEKGWVTLRRSEVFTACFLCPG